VHSTVAVAADIELSSADIPATAVAAVARQLPAAANLSSFVRLPLSSER